MLKITIPDVNGWDSNKEEFVDLKGCTLLLEHSLVSLQKWEAKWNKPYLSNDPKTSEETIDYIRCMCFTRDVDPDIFYHIPKEEMERIAEYIKAPMTATTFSNNAPQSGAPRKKEKVTAEIIYYWMISLGIPMDFRKWHLNQLLTLIRVCEIKNAPAKKMGKNELAARNRSLNAQRRVALHTRG